jgi:hypothetical protein
MNFSDEGIRACMPAAGTQVGVTLRALNNLLVTFQICQFAKVSNKLAAPVSGLYG